MAKKISIPLLANVRKIIDETRQEVVRSANNKIATSYFNIGRLIVNHEQQGKKKAPYATDTLKNLSDQVTEYYGRVFSVDNLENMRRFYLAYSISGKPSRKLVKSSPNLSLSFSHYVFLARIENINERKFYEIEAFNENWRLEELKRPTEDKTLRIVLCKNKKKNIVQIHFTSREPANIHKQIQDVFACKRRPVKINGTGRTILHFPINS